MTSPVNFTDPTGHYFAKIDISGHYNSGSRVVVVPEPEPRPDTTTGSSTGSGGGGAGNHTVARDITNSFLGGQLDRIDAQREDPCFYNVMNNWTWGFWETADRALFNENPGSLDHWLNSISFALTVTMVFKAGSLVVDSLANSGKNAISSSIANGVCFKEGTLVYSDNGYIQIELIKAGDYVYSENAVTGEKGLKKVENTYIRETDVLIKLYVNGAIIETTKEHPFWVNGQGWIPAKEIEIGDNLKLYSNESVIVEKISKKQLVDPVKVYNFEVEDWHTYFVSNKSVLVHNTCGGIPTNLKKVTNSF